MYNCHSCVFTTLLVEVGVVYGRLNKGTECVKECSIFKFECRGVFLGVLRVFLWYVGPIFGEIPLAIRTRIEEFHI